MKMQHIKIYGTQHRAEGEIYSVIYAQNTDKVEQNKK